MKPKIIPLVSEDEKLRLKQLDLAIKTHEATKLATKNFNNKTKEL